MREAMYARKARRGVLVLGRGDGRMARTTLCGTSALTRPRRRDFVLLSGRSRSPRMAGQRRLREDAAGGLRGRAPP